MEMRTQKNGNIAEVAVTGEMNIYNALELKAALVSAIECAEGVDLDLSGVSEFDSSGAQLLLLTRKECELAGKKLTLAGRSAPVDSVIGLFNLGELFGSARQGEA